MSALTERNEMKNSYGYELPDGSTTTTFQYFWKAWRVLCGPVEREFSLRCIQFSSGALFILDEDGEERTEPMPSISLPTWFLIKLAKTCAEATKWRKLLNDRKTTT